MKCTLNKGIYAITDPLYCPDDKLLLAVRQALSGGISVLQFRQKQHKPNLKLLYELKELCVLFSVPLIINDSPWLCKTIGADGVHLGQSDMPLVQAREILGEGAIIGCTCHDDIAYALAAEKNGADYVAFGRFFASNTKVTASSAPLSLLSEAKKRLSIPVVAIGGIDLENISKVWQQGVDLVAMVEAVFASDDICHAVRQLRLTKRDCF